MKNEELERLLVAQNPQWQGGTFPSVNLRYERDILSKLLRERRAHRLILTINGPRRIGKTYLVKQLLARLITDYGVKPTETMYFQFSAQQNTNNSIVDLVTLYLGVYTKQNTPHYIVLDEIQYIDWWQDQVKLLYDANPNIRFVLTGSTSLFYRQKSKESLAGRVLKKTLNTLSFGEYLRFSGISVMLPQTDEYRLSPKERAQFLTDLPLYRSAFRRYLTAGQLPEPVFSPAIPIQEYLTGFLDQLMNFDVAYMFPRLDRTLLARLVKSLSGQIGTEYSINSLAGYFDASRKEVTDYVRILEEIGLFASCQNGYFRKLRARLSGSKKIYTYNTNLSLAVNGFTGEYLQDSRIFGQYVENYVCTCLRARYAGVEYYREKGTSREVDFMTDDFFFEVKSGDIGDVEPYRVLAEKHKKTLVVITESTAKEDRGVRYFPWYVL